MTRSILFAAALALSVTATVAYADSEATFDKTLSVTGAPAVSLSTGSGYIHVTPGPDNQVHIVGHVHSHPGLFSADDSRVKQIAANPPITQSGNTITIAVPHADSDLFNNISIDYDVTAPHSTTLAAHTGSGEIRADGLGPNSRFTSGSGSIHATHISGPTTLETGSGSIELSLSGPGDLKVHTGSGSIHVDGLAGALQAGTGSGSIEIAGSPTADWRLSTGSGGIRLKLATNARFNFDASTGSGSIHVDQPILTQGSLNRHHVTGTVNGGGPAVRASTGSGGITINGSSTVSQLQENNSLHVPGATDCVDNPADTVCRKN
jgi:DUF4097 and DUF4098 domain-containing protein YvlB